MAQGNSIMSATMSNWYFSTIDVNLNKHSLWGMPRTYGNDSCSCGTNAMCSEPADLDGWLVPGFMVGCYPLESLLQSTIECLYNSTCIDKLQHMFFDRNATDTVFDPLDPALSFSNETVQSLLEQLLIESWKPNISYDQYYSSCAPISCTYSILGRPDIWYIVSTLFVVYGALTTTLNIIISIITYIGYRIARNRRERVINVTVATVLPEHLNGV
ncbi:unnamed protein product [Adineta steineri]|uniref:Uncharacterized protein n=1 Tax=Adineta steineri TaxID=433720 RepID=A0A816EL25_9BILA|nr:unnamed protein product [Adineta steineri]CAF1647412.1 unnamed protein product [Adineta steineri]